MQLRIRSIILYVLIIIATAFNCFAQQPLNSAEVESKSLKFYTEKQWDSLIVYGNNALRKHIDYYLLRMRLGIAYYEKKQYRAASPHFEKAIRFNSYDDLPKEYLYYCYLYSERYDEARRIKPLTLISHALPISLIYTEGGIKFSDRTDSVGNMNYFQAGFVHNIGRIGSLFHAFTYLNQNVYWGSFTQEQYYIAANIPLGRGWLFSPAGHFVFLNAPVTVTDVPSVKENPVVASISVRKSYKERNRKSAASYDLKFGLAVSNFYGSTRVQYNFSVIIYPLGNNKLSFAVSSYLRTADSNFVFCNNISMNCVLRKKLKLNTGVYFGNMKYAVEDNGYLVNNSRDLTNARFTLMIDYLISKHIGIYALYQRESKVENFKNFFYNYNTALAGLKLIL